MKPIMYTECSSEIQMLTLEPVTQTGPISEKPVTSYSLFDMFYLYRQVRLRQSCG